MTLFSLCKGSRRNGESGFNILELLVVLSLIVLLAGLSVPAISSLSRGGNVNRATAAAASSLELARQYAVAHNTYTWVIFAEDLEPRTQAVHIVVLGSKDGSRTADGTNAIELDGSGAYDLKTDASNLFQVGKAESCAGARLEELPEEIAPPCPVQFTLPGAVTAIAFLNEHPELQRVVQFAPNGQARVSDSLSQTIGLGITSANNRENEVLNLAKIHVDGFTGMTRVIRQ